MKNISFIVILCLFINIEGLWAQDYLQYYEWCDEAEEQMKLKNYTTALEKFELAFNSVPYVHNYKYIKASKCAVLLGDYEATFRYISASKKQGHPNGFLSKKMFKKFKKTDYYQNYLDSIPTYEAILKASIHQEYAKAIDSLIYVDQYLVRKNRAYVNENYKGNYIVMDKRPENMWDLDKLVFERLLVLIDLYGFPSERLLGGLTHHRACVILQHHLRLEINKEHHDMAKQAVRNGTYLPFNYEVMYEQYCEITGKKYVPDTWEKKH